MPECQRRFTQKLDFTLSGDQKGCTKKPGIRDTLPIHFTSQFNTLKIFDYLLRLYPESASMVEKDGNNILHYAIVDYVNDIVGVEE